MVVKHEAAIDGANGSAREVSARGSVAGGYATHVEVGGMELRDNVGGLEVGGAGGRCAPGGGDELVEAPTARVEASYYRAAEGEIATRGEDHAVDGAVELVW